MGYYPPSRCIAAGTAGPARYPCRSGTRAGREDDSRIRAERSGDPGCARHRCDARASYFTAPFGVLYHAERTGVNRIPPEACEMSRGCTTHRCPSDRREDNALRRHYERASLRTGSGDTNPGRSCRARSGRPARRASRGRTAPGGPSCAAGRRSRRRGAAD